MQVNHSKTMEPNTDFLPQNYEQPKAGGGYMKFKDGENTFRVLSKPIMGWIDWDNKKPIRTPMDYAREDLGKPKPRDPKNSVKHFWTMAVWNYATKAVEILEIDKAGILTSIGKLARDKEWGSPMGYDLKVTKSGQDMATKYATIPSPPKPVHPKILEDFAKKPIFLNQLWTNGDPFVDPQAPGAPAPSPAGTTTAESELPY